MAEENWKRWGLTDERGAVNTIGSHEVLRAVSLVRSGRVVPLGQPLSKRTPVQLHRPPLMHFMNRDGGDYAAGAERRGGFQFAEDTLVLSTHIGTHIDALCHSWYDDTLYNGFPSTGIRSNTGAAHCGIEHCPPIVTRGLLLDIVKHRGAPLEKGACISADELAACAKASGLDIHEGDAVLIRTGWLETHGGDGKEYFSGEPGIDVEAGVWLATAGVAIIGADNFAVEAIPFPAGTVAPVHQRLIRDFGIPLVENLALVELAEAGAREFLLILAPLPIVGATGSPLCPIAVL